MAEKVMGGDIPGPHHDEESDTIRMSLLQLLLFILPLGLDTLGVSLSLGIKSSSVQSTAKRQHEKRILPNWLRSAILFSLAEMLMPLIGLLIGYAASLIVSDIMHYVGALLLIGVGVWELWEEGHEYISKKKKQEAVSQQTIPASPSSTTQFQWGQQFLLALSVSLDELAIGFSLGSITHGRAISPLILCLLIGLQGFLMTILGLVLGRTLSTRLKPLKEWSELFSAVLLIALGIWLLLS